MFPSSAWRCDMDLGNWLLLANEAWDCNFGRPKGLNYISTTASKEGQLQLTPLLTPDSLLRRLTIMLMAFGSDARSIHLLLSLSAIGAESTNLLDKTKIEVTNPSSDIIDKHCFFCLSFFSAGHHFVAVVTRLMFPSLLWILWSKIEEDANFHYWRWRWLQLIQTLDSGHPLPGYVNTVVISITIWANLETVKTIKHSQPNRTQWIK